MKRVVADGTARFDATGARFERREADALDAEADAILTLPTKPTIGAGGELQLSRDEAFDLPGLACTVEAPDMTTAEASRDRLQLTADARCLALAVDLADTFRARDSMAKALAHQAASGHQLALRFAATANAWLDRAQPDSPFGGNGQKAAALVEAQRAGNAAARLMAASGDAALALQRLRTGGRQVVTVQHVTVGDGGQAVVAGTLATGGRRRGPNRK